MPRCLVSEAECETFLNFGKMPIANGFLEPDQFEKEYFFDLTVGFCPESKMVQLTNLVEPQKMFHENYAFFSSTSVRMAQHFQKLAEEIQSRHLHSKDPFVVEIGSNDGITLQHFAKKGIRHLGIEPSTNVAQVARDKGIHTLSKFFDEKLAQEIVASHGQADVFLGANVMCHIPSINSVAAGIRLLLKPAGVVVFEDPYLGDIVQKTSYDQIYDEHAFYFSAASVTHAFGRYDLELIDVAPQHVHGGSLSYTLAHKGAYPASEAVRRQLAKEDSLGLHAPETYSRLRQNIERSRQDLMNLLEQLKRQGKRVVGYGATSKSTTVTNYCGITPDLVEYISDTTPIKQGKYSPGTHIPVRPYKEFAADYPDYALLFAWNHGEEIMAKEQRFRETGGKFIVYVPEVQVV